MQETIISLKKWMYGWRWAYTWQERTCLPVIAGRKGSPVTVVFLSGKGTLSIWGVTQFKELQRKKTGSNTASDYKHWWKPTQATCYRILFWRARSFCSSSQLSWQKTHLCNRVIINFSRCSISWVTWASGKPVGEKVMSYLTLSGLRSNQHEKCCECMYTHC